LTLESTTGASPWHIFTGNQLVRDPENRVFGFLAPGIEKIVPKGKCEARDSKHI
jgi:hypothetical protein